MVGEESVSGFTRGSGHEANQETHLMRIYTIGSDGITLCRDAPATISEGEVAVNSNEELHTAPIMLVSK